MLPTTLGGWNDRKGEGWKGGITEGCILCLFMFLRKAWDLISQSVDMR